MTWCFAFGCGHQTRDSRAKRSERTSKGVRSSRYSGEFIGPFCALYRFPKNPQEFKKWKVFCKRQDAEPNINSRLCSCHFAGKDKSEGPSYHFFEGARKPLHFPELQPARKRRKVCEKLENETPEIISDTPRSRIVCVEDERSAMRSEIMNLKKEKEAYEAQVSSLTLELHQTRFCFDLVKTRSMVQYYTSLAPQTFLDLATGIKLCKIEGFTLGSVMNVNDELLMVLMKLRHNFGFDDLSVRFFTSPSTLRRLFYNLLYVLHSVVYVAMIEETFPTLQQIQNSLKPEIYREFPNVRVIIDCTEVRCPAPPGMDKKAHVYSNYKSNYTYKGLVGVAPNGKIIFASGLYGGSTSDKEITKQCGLLELLKPGDCVMADKGFTISDILPQGVSLNIPPFLCRDGNGKRQFTEEQGKRTTKIARARIHVERVMPRIKLFKLLSELRATQRAHASVLFRTCCGLVNMQPPILKNK